MDEEIMNAESYVILLNQTADAANRAGNSMLAQTLVSKASAVLLDIEEV